MDIDLKAPVDNDLILIMELKKVCTERDWLAEMLVAVHESGYCPPHRECPVGDYTLPTQENCKDCWLRAAREAVKEK